MMWNAALIDGPIEVRQFLGLDEEGQPQFGDPLPVYNLNIAANLLTPELEPFVIEPSIPKRVFAGDDPQARTLTVCLTFADENAARAVLSEFWIDD